MQSLDPSRQRIAAALSDREAADRLVAELRPVIHARVARALIQRRSRSTGDLRAMLEDMIQDVLLSLFRDDGKLLRTWDPERGLSLASFVGLIAEQRVYATLRSRRRNPWSEELAIDDAELPQRDERGPEAQVSSRQELERLLDEVRARLSPMGLELFFALIVREESPSAVCARTNMSVSAVHAWSSRLRRLVRELGTPLERGSE